MKNINSRLTDAPFSGSVSNRTATDMQNNRAEFLKIEKSAAAQLNSRSLGNDNIFRLQTSVDLQYVKEDPATPMVPYREAVCALCEKTVSLALGISLESFQAKTRCNAETALARQIAMYLCHTTFSLLLTEVGLHFGRDRTTVSYACALVEDKRDDPQFDLILTQLESLLVDARHAMSICIEHQANIDSAGTGEQADKSGIREKLLLSARRCR